MASFYDRIPGYRDAVARETIGRDAAYLRLPRLVVGVTLRALTLRDYLRLSAESSPFMAGGKPGKDDCAFLLWHQRLDACVDLEPAVFAGRFDEVDTLFLVASCAAYVAEALADAPEGSGSKRGGYYGVGAMLISAFRREYPGCTRVEILDSPIDELWQEWRVFQERKGAVLFNRSDRIKGHYLASLNGTAVEAPKKRKPRH